MDYLGPVFESAEIEAPDAPVAADGGRLRFLPLPAGDVRQVQAEILARAEQPIREEPRHPGELAAAWLLEYRSPNTRAAYASDLARFFVWCSVHAVHVFEVRRHHLAAYLDEPRSDGRPFAPKTLERRLAAISSYYAHALELDLVSRHPRGHRKPLVVRASRAQGAASLSKHEFERFLAAASEHSPNALAIVLLLGLYGLRVTEVCQLQLEQIDWDQGQPILRVAGKGRADNETTAMPLPIDILTALEHAAAGRTTGTLLRKSTGRPYVRQEITALLKTVCRRAQLTTKLSPHGLRATFITLALNEGVALRDVQDAARHADPRTTRLYDRDASALSRHPVHRLVSLTPEQRCG